MQIAKPFWLSQTEIHLPPIVELSPFTQLRRKSPFGREINFILFALSTHDIVANASLFDYFYDDWAIYIIYKFYE